MSDELYFGQEFLTFAKKLAYLSGRTLSSYYKQLRLDSTIETGPKGIVTAADLRNDQLIRESIEYHYPEHGIITEEGSPVEGNEYVWVIDPIDGTNNFSRHIPLFSISMGLRQNGEEIVGVVYLPVMKEMYYALKGQGAYREYAGRTTRLHVSGPESLDMFNFSFSPSIDVIEPEKHDRYIDGIRKSGLFRNMRRRIFESTAYELCLVASGALDVHYNNYANPWDWSAGKIMVTEAGGEFTHLPDYGNPYGNIIASNGVIHDQLVELYNRAMSE